MTPPDADPRPSPEALLSQARATLLGHTPTQVLPPQDAAALRTVLDSLTLRAGIELNVVLEADSGVAIKDAVRRAGLHSILPAHAVSAEVEAGSLVPLRLTDPSIRQTVLMDLSRQRPATAATRLLYKALPELAREVMAGAR